MVQTYISILIEYLQINVITIVYNSITVICSGGTTVEPGEPPSGEETGSCYVQTSHSLIGFSSIRIIQIFSQKTSISIQYFISCTVFKTYLHFIMVQTYISILIEYLEINVITIIYKGITVTCSGGSITVPSPEESTQASVESQEQPETGSCYVQTSHSLIGYSSIKIIQIFSQTTSISIEHFISCTIFKTYLHFIMVQTYISILIEYLEINVITIMYKGITVTCSGGSITVPAPEESTQSSVESQEQPETGSCYVQTSHSLIGYSSIKIIQIFSQTTSISIEHFISCTIFKTYLHFIMVQEYISILIEYLEINVITIIYKSVTVTCSGGSITVPVPAESTPEPESAETEEPTEPTTPKKEEPTTQCYLQTSHSLIGISVTKLIQILSTKIEISETAFESIEIHSSYLEITLIEKYISVLIEYFESHTITIIYKSVSVTCFGFSLTTEFKTKTATPSDITEEPETEVPVDPHEPPHITAAKVPYELLALLNLRYINQVSFTITFTQTTTLTATEITEANTFITNQCIQQYGDGVQSVTISNTGTLVFITSTTVQSQILTDLQENTLTITTCAACPPLTLVSSITVCFSGNSIVDTISGPVRMDHLREGDQVQTMKTLAGKAVLTYEPIHWFIHRDHEATADFIQLRTSSNAVLKLSHKHMLPVVDCGLDLSIADYDDVFAENAVFSEKVRPGSCLLVQNDGQVKIEKVEEVSVVRETGIFSPVTDSGMIIVNGVHASCFSSVESHRWLKVAFRMMRVLSDAVEYMTGYTWAKDSLRRIDIPAVLRYCLRATSAA